MIVLDGRTIIVTGAAQGLGRAMSLGLLTAGANVVAADLSSNPAFPELQGLAEAAGARRRMVSIGGDVTDPAQCKAIVDAGLRAFGTIDGLVNNAGLGMNGITAKVISAPKLFHQLAPEQWRAVMRVNIDGPFMMAQAASVPMLASGGGKIVNILTSRATMVLRGFSPYGPSKAAMEAATAIWAQDLAGSGITVNGLLPGGAADTPMIPAEEDIDRAKLIRPDAMVEPIRWLMSSHSDGVTAKRFIATEWREGLPPERIAAELAREAGWAGSV